MNRRDVTTHVLIPSFLGLFGGFVGAIAQGVVQERLKDQHRLTLTLHRSTETRPASGNSDLMAYEYTGIVSNDGDFTEEDVVINLVVRGREDITIMDHIVSANPALLLTSLEYQEDWSRASVKTFEATIDRLSPGESIRLYIQALQVADFFGETRSSTDWDEGFLFVPTET